MARLKLISFSLGAAMVVPQIAFAHVGQGDVHDALHGFVHPLTGVDHILAMVSIGLLAAHIGGWALVAVPLSFVGMMVIGGVVAIAGYPLPFIELGIAASVMVLGALLAVGTRPPVALAMALAAIFAIFHGYAHGLEMPEDASGLSFALGFAAATALLHGAGIITGLALGKLSPALAKPMMKLGGGAIAVTGIALAAGLI